MLYVPSLVLERGWGRDSFREKMPKVPEKACLGSDHHLNERNKREEKEKLYTKGGST